ncbi:hypothetical protein RB2083_2714 [Rhodobacteraceae bacterium HTCC2083]|nr:hypothetical protein RB2083_2714 [Rhodobacteraceae bacterium HTCC2083]
MAPGSLATVIFCACARVMQKIAWLYAIAKAPSFSGVREHFP